MVFSGFQNFGTYLEAYGVMDFLLPFILVFTIVFAVMQKMNILGENKKNFNVIIALVLALLFVVPHITGSYPISYDPVDIMNQTLPSISLVAVAAIMLMLLMGIFGTGFVGAAKPWIALASLIFVGYIFGSALNLWTGPYDIFYWWTTEVTELLIIILVFGLIVYWITKDSGDKVSMKDAAQGVENFVGKYFKKD
jgi:hypothetical protein